MITYMLILTVFSGPFTDEFLIDYDMSFEDCQAAVIDYQPNSGNPLIHVGCVEQDNW